VLVAHMSLTDQSRRSESRSKADRDLIRRLVRTTILLRPTGPPHFRAQPKPHPRLLRRAPNPTPADRSQWPPTTGPSTPSSAAAQVPRSIPRSPLPMPSHPPLNSVDL
jgi:hypothetical protein